MGAEEVFIISDIETATSILGTEWLLIEDPNTKGLYKKVSTQEVVKGFINGYPIDNTDIADGRILSFDAVNSKFIYIDLTLFVEEAPKDGKIYARKDETWVEIVI